VNKFAEPATILKLDDSRNFREQRIISPYADIQTRLEFCSALPDQDGAATHTLTREALYPKSLGLAVAAIP